MDSSVCLAMCAVASSSLFWRNGISLSWVDWLDSCRERAELVAVRSLMDFSLSFSRLVRLELVLLVESIAWLDAMKLSWSFMNSVCFCSSAMVEVEDRVWEARRFLEIESNSAPAPRERAERSEVHFKRRLRAVSEQK